MSTALTDGLAWVVVGLFVGSAVLEWRDRTRLARLVGTAAWGVFAAFWLALVPHFAFVQKSIIEGALSLVAVPACLYTGYLLVSGRDSLFVVTRALAVMGVLYLPMELLPVVSQPVVETVTNQTAVVLSALGYEPAITTGNTLPYRNTFVFVGETGRRYSTEVVIACTGIGSMAIFAGLIAAVRAPLGRKLRALAIALPIIYALNVLRVSFITIAHGEQWFRSAEWVLWLFGSSDPTMASFFIADRIIAQSLSVVALVAIAWLVARELPELLAVLEELAYLATGAEYDLQSAVSTRNG